MHHSTKVGSNISNKQHPGQITEAGIVMEVEGTFGTAVGTSTVQKGNFNCMRDSHHGHEATACQTELNLTCPLMQSRPVAHVVGHAVRGLGFYHIPHPPLPKTKKESWKALITVMGGSLTKEQIIIQLQKLFPFKWRWELMDHEQGFVTQFPSKVELQRSMAFGGADVKVEGAAAGMRLQFSEWLEKEDGFLLPKVWVRVFGISENLRDFLNLWAVGSMLGSTQTVDMEMTRKNDFGRICIAVLKPKLLPSHLGVVIGDHFFKLRFEVEKIGVDENGDEVELDISFSEKEEIKEGDLNYIVNNLVGRDGNITDKVEGTINSLRAVQNLSGDEFKLFLKKKADELGISVVTTPAEIADKKKDNDQYQYGGTTVNGEGPSGGANSPSLADTYEHGLDSPELETHQPDAAGIISELAETEQMKIKGTEAKSDNKKETTEDSSMPESGLVVSLNHTVKGDFVKVAQTNPNPISPVRVDFDQVQGKKMDMTRKANFLAEMDTISECTKTTSQISPRVSGLTKEQTLARAERRFAKKNLDLDEVDLGVEDDDFSPNTSDNESQDDFLPPCSLSHLVGNRTEEVFGRDDCLLNDDFEGIFWNSRGLSDLAKKPFLVDTTKEQHLDFIALLETGGILLGVNLDSYDIGSIEEGDFYVKFRLRNKEDEFQWILVAVYGAVQPEFKEAFLTELVRTCSNESLPLLVGGDFNIIRNSSEKNNDRYNEKWPFLFNAVIDSLNLRELQMSGRKFTWANSLEVPTFERLDRILMSTEWEQKFPLATVVALSREISDHTPLLLNSGAKTHRCNQPVFRFELGWLQRKDFFSRVAEVWNGRNKGSNAMEVWQNKIRRLRQFLRGWARNIEDIPQVSWEENKILTEPFTEKEVRDTIFQMKLNKAPGPDGFPVEFYQEFWGLLKRDLLQMFEEFHKGVLPLCNLNFGTITLLPKLKEVKQIQQYRPICLLNVSFKVFTKVIANRAAAVAQKIVRPSQTAFMTGRNILEGVVILHETLHELKRKKNSMKAYDKVNWDFLQQTLCMKGFSNIWCGWIEKVVSKGKVNVKVNDELGHYFQTRKGVRQGDPLSPFLFNLIADMLAVLIARAKENGQFRGIIPHLVEGGLSILQYADDTILFLEHDFNEAVNLKLVLSVFEQLSGHKINFHKSEVFLFGEAKFYKEEYIQLFGCKEGVFPFKYLGIPMHHKKLFNKDWIEVEERFQKKLGSWKGKLLSTGGRLVLINSVLSSLPMFMFSFFETPKGVIKKLDYYRSRFFWQCDEHKKKYRLAKWTTLSKPKCFGGLGILGKWLLKFLNEEGACQELLKNKYLRHKLLSQCTKKLGDSQFWSGLMAVKDIFLSYGSFKIQNGQTVRFWEDTWKGNKPFMELYPNLYRIVRKKNVTLANVLSCVPLNISFRRALVGDNLKSWFELVSRVTSVSLVEGSDRFNWDLNKGGSYSVLVRNWILWKLKVPLKIKIFLWYLRTGVILTKDNLAKRNWIGNTKCCFCNLAKSIRHLFFDCHVARAIWSTIFIAFGIKPPINVTMLLGSWLNGFTKKLKYSILLGVAAICWAIWSWRNDVVFNERTFNSFAQVIYRGTFWIRCWSLLCKEEEKENLKMRCMHLESVVLELFFKFGWRRSYRIEA
ncbi:hypothetical protein U9M48_005442 [Paspalum notatum var. saurae]|uniref:Reverse transcriptase domain-containing protein n=1 Tax=Paspalum notatum var. saurae TaxID=547442 RepID=A0AAQ3SLT8_PASNO